MQKVYSASVQMPGYAGAGGKAEGKMGIFARRAAVRQLDEKLERIQNNFENNYKDAAQLNLREFGELFQDMCREGRLSEKQEAYYSSRLEEFGERLKNFTHKDQKPTWT